MHAESLRVAGGADLETAVAVSTDWRKAHLQREEYAMLEFGEKLSLLPRSMKEDDIGLLRRYGYSDRDILGIVQASAYRNFITRVADGLGVELNVEHTIPVEILQAFGVSEEESRTTIYRDRVFAAEEQKEATILRPSMSRQGGSSDRVPWIETASDAGLGVIREMERVTSPYPLRNLALAFSLRPEALQATLGFGQLVGMGGSGLGFRVEAIIGLAVASALGVHYMGVHHAQAYMDAGATANDVAALIRDPAGGGLDGLEHDVARFVEKLTRAPSAMAQSDLDTLRRGGLNPGCLGSFRRSGCYAPRLSVVLTNRLMYLLGAVLPPRWGSHWRMRDLPRLPWKLFPRTSRLYEQGHHPQSIPSPLWRMNSPRVERILELRFTTMAMIAYLAATEIIAPYMIFVTQA